MIINAIEHGNLETKYAAKTKAHGRGIAITRRLFDVVRYNAAGNQVTLVKFCPGMTAKRRRRAT